jgi:hypothetical protein
VGPFLSSKRFGKPPHGDSFARAAETFIPIIPLTKREYDPMTEERYRPALETWTKQEKAKADAAVAEILSEEFSLARPDDLAFLESQVLRIARRIVDRLGLPGGS